MRILQRQQKTKNDAPIKTSTIYHIFMVIRNQYQFILHSCYFTSYVRIPQKKSTLHKKKYHFDNLKIKRNGKFHIEIESFDLKIV